MKRNTQQIHINFEQSINAYDPIGISVLVTLCKHVRGSCFPITRIEFSLNLHDQSNQRVLQLQEISIYSKTSRGASAKQCQNKNVNCCLYTIT